MKVVEICNPNREGSLRSPVLVRTTSGYLVLYPKRGPGIFISGPDAGVSTAESFENRPNGWRLLDSGFKVELTQE